MKNKNLICFLVSIFLLMSSAFVYGKSYKVAVTQTPTAPMYIELIKAIAEVTDNIFDIQVVPRNRAMYLIENKQVDFQLPDSEIPDPVKQKELKYDYSSIAISKVCFVLYSNKNKNINVNELKKGNPKKYLIEADTSHIAHYFDFVCIGSTNVEGSLKRVDMGKIDGYIYTQTKVDAALKKLGLKNVKRQFYSFYNVKISTQKGAKGVEVDKMLTDGINKLKTNGRFDKITSELIKTNQVYNDWQP